VTYDDDMIRFDDGLYAGMNVRLKDLGLEWPPPEQVKVAVATPGVWPLGHLVYNRCMWSEITDEERATMTNVFRGSVYRLAAANSADSDG
jgi:hypothetical protein